MRKSILCQESKGSKEIWPTAQICCYLVIHLVVREPLCSMHHCAALVVWSSSGISPSSVMQRCGIPLLRHEVNLKVPKRARLVMELSIKRQTYHRWASSLAVSDLGTNLPTYRLIDLSTYLSIYLSICLFISLKKTSTAYPPTCKHNYRHLYLLIKHYKTIWQPCSQPSIVLHPI